MAKKSSSTNWVNIIGWLVIVVVVVGVFIFISNQNNAQEEVLAANLVVTAQDHIKGNPNARVVLIEYGDYECPYCAAFHSVVEQVMAEFGDEVAFVYRHFPLTGIHRNALAAAKAVEAAGLQGKYWEMHNMLFVTQSSWSSAPNAAEIFAGFAENLELDMDKYNSDLNSDAVVTKINTDRRTASENSVDSTPTLFLNNREIQAFNSVTALRQVIEAEIASLPALDTTSDQETDAVRSEDETTDTDSSEAEPE